MGVLNPNSKGHTKAWVRVWVVLGPNTRVSMRKERTHYVTTGVRPKNPPPRAGAKLEGGIFNESNE